MITRTLLITLGVALVLLGLAAAGVLWAMGVRFHERSQSCE